LAVKTYTASNPESFDRETQAQTLQLRPKQVQKYVSRRKDKGQKYRRRSIFGMGQDGEQWVNYLAQHSESVRELISLTRNKRRFYQQGIRAATLMGSNF